MINLKEFEKDCLYKKEIRPLLNANKDGKWLILLEDQSGYELPWNLIKESEPLDIIFLEG